MNRALITALILFVLTASGWADVLVLSDGRSFEGEVTVHEGSVLVRVAHGTLRFPRSDVARIERRQTPQAQLAAILEEIQKDDADSLCMAAKWAADNGLGREAEDLFAEAMEISPDHPEARRALGYMRIEDRWYSVDQAIELAESRLAAGRPDELLQSLLPELLPLARVRGQGVAVRDLTGRAQLQARRFDEALDTFRKLATSATAPANARFEAIAGILADNEDGMYLLNEPFPPDRVLLSTSRPALEAGPVSLSNPMALQAALRDRARVEIAAGRKLMDQATGRELDDVEAAKLLYSKAGAHFDRADAMVPDLAKSYRLEIARRRIATVRKRIDSEAQQFDSQMDRLARDSMSPDAYRAMVGRMIRSLDGVRNGLREVIELAQPYPRQLVLELNWAQVDLKKIEAMRKILRAELDEQG
jgi:tetratricopeptide (TPR) repeat protein